MPVLGNKWVGPAQYDQSTLYIHRPVLWLLWCDYSSRYLEGQVFNKVSTWSNQTILHCLTAVGRGSWCPSSHWSYVPWAKSWAVSSSTCFQMPGFSCPYQQSPHFTAVQQDQLYKRLIQTVLLSKHDVMAVSDPVHCCCFCCNPDVVSLMELPSLEEIVPST